MSPGTRLFSAVWLALLMACGVSAQEPTLRFDRLGVDDGLSQSTIITLLQDRLGLLWIGTDDGLNRFDGQAFRTYRPVPGDSTSLPHPTVHALWEAVDGSLWVGTYGNGLAVLDPQTGRVVHHHLLEGEDALRITTLAGTPDSTLWAGTYGGGLHSVDPESGASRRFSLSDGLASDTVRTLLATDRGQLWIGTESGDVQRLEPTTQRFSQPLVVGEGRVTALVADGDWLWVGTEGDGLSRVHTPTGAIEVFGIDPNSATGLSSADVQDLHLDEDGSLWINTLGGLHRFDTATGRFTRYAHRTEDPRSPASNRGRALYRTRDGTLWVGSWDQGLSRLSTTLFPLFSALGATACGPSSDDYRVFAEGPDGALWLGTVAGGLMRLDPVTGCFTTFRHDPQRAGSIDEDHVRAIHVAEDGGIWVGLNSRGLQRLDPATGRFHMAAAVGRRGVKTIVPDPSGALWLGLFGGGLIRFDPGSGRITDEILHDPDDPASLPDNNVYWVERARDGALWVGSWGGGLARVDPTSGRATHRLRHDPNDVTSLGDDAVTVVLEAHDGTLWAGTYGGGLARIDAEHGRVIRRYTTADGLANPTLYGIVEDESGFLWLSTNRGLSRFDPESETFTNFGPADGLQSNEFNGSAFLRQRDGHLVFGGIAGFNRFDPASLRLGEPGPEVVYTSLTVDGEAAPTTMGDIVTVPYGATRISASFAALDFGRPHAIRYQYRLVGLDEAWVEAQAARTATFTHLPSGSYALEVRAAGPHSAWGEPLVLGLRVPPPVWQEPWFLALAAVLMVGLIGLIAREGPALASRLWARLPHRRVVSHYRLDELIGSGGAGQVWRARNLGRRPGEPRDVAVKLLHVSHLQDDGSTGVQRLRREAELLSSFDHPNIVRIYETGVWKSTAFIAMQLLHGETLRDRIEHRGALSVDEALPILIAVSDALAAVHEAGTVHRDVKSENVMLVPDGDEIRAVLMDFGLARGTNLTTLTQLGQLLGTLGYAAPEQAMGREADFRSDVFALAVVMYEAFTGRLPFDADNEIAMLHAIFNQEPAPLHKLVPGLDEAISRLVMVMLSKEPDERPESAREVVSTLTTIHDLRVA